jgi:hypothetical protein
MDAKLFQKSLAVNLMLPTFTQIQKFHQVEEMMIVAKPKGLMPKKLSQT